MSNVVVTLQGRVYTIACDDGQERRVQQLALYVDGKLRDIARSGAAVSEQYQFVLGSLMLADEILTMRENGEGSGDPEALQKISAKAQRQTEIDVAAVQHLTQRLEELASTLQDADA